MSDNEVRDLGEYTASLSSIKSVLWVAMGKAYSEAYGAEPNAARSGEARDKLCNEALEAMKVDMEGVGAAVQEFNGEWEKEYTKGDGNRQLSMQDRYVAAKVGEYQGGYPILEVEDLKRVVANEVMGLIEEKRLVEIKYLEGKLEEEQGNSEMRYASLLRTGAEPKKDGHSSQLLPKV